MRHWTYSWMSSDGHRHEGEMNAPDKDSVYAALRERGIRAIKVTERIRPVVRRGFRGLRKRDWVIAAVVLVVFSSVFYFIADSIPNDKKPDADPIPPPSNPSAFTPPNANPETTPASIAVSRPRRFITLPSGFSAASVFTRPHEVYLAAYALPGILPDAIPELTPELQQDFYDNVNAPIYIAPDDSSAVADLKRIVAGLKDDARKYLSVTDGIAKLGAWLAERQAMEADYRQRFIERVKSGSLSREEANDIFRAMGLAELP